MHFGKSLVIETLKHRSQHEHSFCSAGVDLGRRDVGARFELGNDLEKIVVKSRANPSTSFSNLFHHLFDLGVDHIDRGEPSLSLREHPMDVRHPTREQGGGLVLKLDIRDHGRIDHLVDALAQSLGFELELLDVRESVHPWGSTISIIRHEVPTSNDCGVLVESPLSKKAWAIRRTSLRTSGTSPLPVTLTVLECFRDSILPPVNVRLDHMRDDQLAG